MSTAEALGFFWIVLAAGLFTATVLIAAGVAIVMGVQILYRRYRRGASEELAAIADQADLKQMKATGR